VTQVPTKRRAVRIPGRDPVRNADPLARFYLDNDPIVQQVTTPKSAEQQAMQRALRDALAGKGRD
jgi:hypothetical protein